MAKNSHDHFWLSSRHLRRAVRPGSNLVGYLYTLQTNASYGNSLYPMKLIGIVGLNSSSREKIIQKISARYGAPQTRRMSMMSNALISTRVMFGLTADDTPHDQPNKKLSGVSIYRAALRLASLMKALQPNAAKEAVDAFGHFHSANIETLIVEDIYWPDDALWLQQQKRATLIRVYDPDSAPTSAFKVASAGDSVFNSACTSAPPEVEVAELQMLKIHPDHWLNTGNSEVQVSHDLAKILEAVDA